MKNYTKFAVKGAAIVFVTSIFGGFLGYIVRMLLARKLTLEEFGLFYAVFAFLALLSLFKSLGYDRSLIKFIPEFYHSNRKDLIKSSIVYISIIQLIMNILIIVAVYSLSNYLSVHFFHSSQAGTVLRLMAIAFFIDSFVAILRFVFQGFQKMLLFSLIDVVKMILIIIIVIVGFKMNYGLISPIFAYIISPIILLIIFGFLLIKNVFPDFFYSKFVIDRDLLKKISRYSIYIMATSSGVMILGYTDSMVLTYFSGLEAVALYSIALPTAKILTYLPTAVGEILLPLTSELWTKKRNNLLKAGIESLYKYSIVIITPLALVMVSFSDFIITVLFGNQYIQAGGAMKILAVGIIFLTLHIINAYFISGIGKPEIHTKIVYMAAVFNLITNLILIPILGVIGAALTTSTSYFIMMSVGLLSIRKFIPLKFPLKIWIKTLIAGLVFIFVTILLKGFLLLNPWLEIIIVLAIAGIVYIALLFFLRVININELIGLYKRIVR